MIDEDVPEETDWELSPSVKRARNKFEDDDRITAGEIVKNIIDIHPNKYAPDRTTGWVEDWSPSPGAVHRTTEEWLNEVKTLFDLNRAESLGLEPLELFGRLAIIGLAMLDPSLRESLRREDILTALRDEMDEQGPTYEEFLTAKGQALRERDDQVAPLTDAPVESVEADRLQRADFASYLAERVAYLRLSTEDAFTILLYGPWGSGKSTLFNFLREELHQRRQVILSRPVRRAVEGDPVERAVGKVRRAFEKVPFGLEEGEDIGSKELTAAELAAHVHLTLRSDGRTSNGDMPVSAAEDWLERSADTQQTPPEWFEEVRTLYMHDRVRELDAPLVLLGLAMLDQQLREDFIESKNYLQSLVDERDVPFEELLSERGQVLGRALLAETADHGSQSEEDNDDRGEEDTASQDADGRDSDSQETDGREGDDDTDETDGTNDRRSGEADDVAGDAVGRMAEEELKIPSSEQAWQIVRFNAWQHQHIDPPWWALMDRIFKESTSELSRFNYFLEKKWRWSTKRLAIVGATTLGVWIIVLVFLLWVLSEGTDGGFDLDNLAVLVDNVEGIFGLLIAIGAGISAVSKPTLDRRFIDSAHAAKSYVKFSNEPMKKVKERFNTLVERVPKHLLVFIDDLDRCRSEYVVELLEGIQTLFKDAPVVFVIAADDRWVETCFEQVYDGHADAVHQPGKTLGILFTEKAFQFSAPVPGVPNEVHKSYWWHLLDVAPDEGANIKTKGSSVEEDDDEEQKNRGNGGPPRDDRTEEDDTGSDVKRWALPEVEAQTENMLQVFRPLLDENPRAMKQLVNSYSMNRAIATLKEADVGQEPLALWTILSLRWPILARHLEHSPDEIEKFKNLRHNAEGGDEEYRSAGIDEDLQPLFDRREVREEVVNVLTGNADQVKSELDADSIEACANLYS